MEALLAASEIGVDAAFGSYAPGAYRVLAELADGPRVEAELRVAPEEFLPLVLELR